jgi:DNA-binding transcriptional ArsR family regulator
MSTMTEINAELDLLKIMAERLKIMGHPMRLMIIGVLKHGEVAVTDISTRIALPISAVSQHLKAMEKVGLLSSRRQGRQIYYSIHAPMVSEICMSVCRQFELDLDRNSTQRQIFEGLQARLQG